MNLLSGHDRKVHKPFTNDMMMRAVKMSMEMTERVSAMKEKELEIDTLKKKLDLVRTGKCDEKDPQKLQALIAEAKKLEAELDKARIDKIEKKKNDSVALMLRAKLDETFNKAVDEEAVKATTNFTQKFKPNITGAKGAVADVSKVCWRLANTLKLPGIKVPGFGSKAQPKGKAKAQSKKTPGGADAGNFVLSEAMLEQIQNMDPELKKQMMAQKEKDMQ